MGYVMKQPMTSLLLIGLVAGVQAADVHLRGKPVPLLNTTVIQRSLEELNVAENANLQAKDTAKAAHSQQDNYAAHVTVKNAMEDYDKISEMVPEARAQALQTRMFAAEARQHADHVLEIERGMRHIPEIAAEHSEQAVKGWIASEAAKSAKASAQSPAEAAKSKKDKIAASVAAAAEPYHLALLRNQKFVAETYNKAKTAQQSYQALQTKATKIALTAQQLQAGGLGVDAQQMMGTARGMMTEADNLRQWGLKLYAQANTAEKNIGTYTAEAQQAATNAAMTIVVNPPMKLP